MLDDDYENKQVVGDDVDHLLDDISISSEEEKKEAMLKGLLPVSGWGFPSWVFSQGESRGFGKGIFALGDEVRHPDLFANRFIPWAAHLVPKNVQADRIRVDTFHQVLMHYGVLWCCFERITPSFLLLLNCRPAVKRVAYLEHLEQLKISQYELEKQLYADAWHEYQDMISTARDNLDDQKIQELIKKLAVKFTHRPEQFAQTADGRKIILDYLFNTRMSRMKEDVSISQYETPYFSPTLPVYEILFLYHSIKDAMDVYCGFINPETNSKKYKEFTETCNRANLRYISDLSHNLNLVLKAFPKVSTALSAIHAHFDEGHFIPQLSEDLCPVDDLLEAMHMYTVNMIVAVERCIMEYIGLTDDVKAALSTTMQSARYVNPELDHQASLRHNRNYNSMVHSLRTKFLPNWPNIASGEVACLDQTESRSKIEAYAKNVILHLARHTYDDSRANRFYLQMKQIVSPSKINPIQHYTPQRRVTLFKTDTPSHEIKIFLD